VEVDINTEAAKMLCRTCHGMTGRIRLSMSWLGLDLVSTEYRSNIAFDKVKSRLDKARQYFTLRLNTNIRSMIIGNTRQTQDA
jgi:hypothetical protein